MAASSLQAFSGKPTFSLPPLLGYLKVPNELKRLVVEKALDLGSQFLFFAALLLVACAFASLPLSSARHS